MIALGFGSIAVVAFMYPFAAFARGNGKCTIGLPLRVTIPLLSYEIVINVALTGIFIGLLRQILRIRDPVHSTVGGSSSEPRSSRRFANVAKSISLTALRSKNEPIPQPPSTPNIVAFDPNMKALKKLIYKSLLAAGLILIATIVNIALLYKWR